MANTELANEFQKFSNAVMAQQAKHATDTKQHITEHLAKRDAERNGKTATQHARTNGN